MLPWPGIDRSRKHHVGIIDHQQGPARRAADGLRGETRPVWSAGRNPKRGVSDHVTPDLVWRAGAYRVLAGGVGCGRCRQLSPYVPVPRSPRNARARQERTWNQSRDSVAARRSAWSAHPKPGNNVKASTWRGRTTLK
jgi:hypothetical protein